MAARGKGCASGIGCLASLGLIMFILCGGLLFFNGRPRNAPQSGPIPPPAQPRQPAAVEPVDVNVRAETPDLNEKSTADVSPPESEPRTWTSSDGKFKTDGSLVGVADAKVQLKKSDGKIIDVPLHRLSQADQQFVKEHSLKGGPAPDPSEPIAKFTACMKNGTRLPVRDYKEDGEGYVLFSVGGGKIRYAKGLIERFEPCTDDDLAALRRKIAATEKQAALRHAAQEEKARQQEAAKEHAKARSVDVFLQQLADAGIDRSVIDSVSARGETARITVSNGWHVTAYQIRLQAAQNLWKLWASIASPSDPDKARITLVDFNGNEVGGSRIIAGSLIWVQD